ncbi:MULTISPECIES: type VI secretion system contractile sheath small subunit [unclassified Roseibium]|uniref:type VI secretion system contractile sheath small subunit n=1 Tax=unclassified Roseibium TaxID=2629323 RepID=UPI00092CB3F4|nr:MULTISPECIES: type VI secretion system contractile sheath small subunit [unclassified Roseibium]OJJ11782.1 type VI secretion system-associated protein [Alphaproteobacteria bacterium AO1-B]
MASKSGQSFIKRNRPPRVHIFYEDPFDAEQKVELPFVMGIMADLSGDSPGVEKPDISDRKLADIDMDNFNSRMKAIQPGTSFTVKDRLSGEEGSKMSVQLRFENMDDFSPGRVAEQVPALNKLLEARRSLAALRTMMDGRVKAISQLEELTKDPALMAALAKQIEAEKSQATDTADDGSEDKEA